MKIMWLLTIVCLMLTGCNGTNNESKDTANKGPTNVSTKTGDQISITDNAVAKNAKEKVLKYDEVTEVIAVHHDLELILAFNIKKMQEFNVKKIEKRVKKELEKEFPNELITVSHDKKIMMELSKLKKEQEKLSPMEIKKRMSKIKKLSQEKT
ncbi:YhcN/YlaJ family sporulation lipoprotein [Bacillus salitolerans]|uniref:YhcN/YlaJ family sporulation lipoprotein n=1 Tax=Bacillus salitolerans TaxID=1437434 RepID=A0ABW4LMS0_9BACI